MKNHKHIATGILLTLVTAGTLTSCLNNEDPYQAGFIFSRPQFGTTGIFANTTGDSLIMQCYGPWEITAKLPGQSWVTIDQMKGKGSAIYSLGVSFEQNTTGAPRVAQFTIRDTDHPDEAYASWSYLQYATRGDGSLGSAPLVRTISSSDGYKATIDYDQKSRPVKYILTNPLGGVAEQTTMTYSETTSTLIVTRGSTSMSGAMDEGSQADRLVGVSDTVGYYSQYYPNGMSMPYNNAFNLISSSPHGLQAFSYLLGGQSLSPDSLHTADSLRYVRQWNEDRVRYVEKLKLEYSSADNRHQSIDPNQLLLGFAECSSLQLLSMFRYTRSTSIVSRAISELGSIDVATELNTDGSVKRMTVSDRRKGTEVVYEFGY